MALKLLLLTYHFPPMEATASMRALGFAKDLPSHGIALTVLTFAWPGVFDDNALPSRVIRLPQPAHPFVLPTDNGSVTGKLKRKYHTFRRFRGGMFDPIHASAETAMTAKAEELLRTEHFDGVIGIFSPHFHLRQCAHLRATFGVPYIIDFRDLWNNALLGADHKVDASSRTRDALVKLYWKKWMRQAAGFTTISAPFKAYLSRLLKLDGEVVRNGFFMKDIRESNEQFETFTLTHVGTIVQWEGMGMHLKYLRSYRENHPEIRFRIMLIGVHSFMKRPLNALITQYELDDIVEIRERVPFEEARTILRKSHILIFPVFPKGKGIYTSRIFEYLAARRPILAVPEDLDVITELMETTHAGLITGNELEYHAFVSQQFGHWQERGDSSSDLSSPSIESFSREAQHTIFADYLKTCFRK